MNSDDQVWLACRDDVGADDFRVSAKAAFPEGITEDDDVATMGAVLGGRKGASSQDWRAKETKIVHVTWMPCTCSGSLPREVESGTALVVARNILENAGLLVPDVELGARWRREMSPVAPYSSIAPVTAARDR